MFLMKSSKFDILVKHKADHKFMYVNQILVRKAAILGVASDKLKETE